MKPIFLNLIALCLLTQSLVPQMTFANDPTEDLKIALNSFNPTSPNSTAFNFTSLGEADVADLSRWGGQAVVKLNMALETFAEDQLTKEHVENLTQATKDALSMISPTGKNLFMFEILDRSLNGVQKILNEHYTDDSLPGAIDLKIKNLSLSIKLALEYFHGYQKYENKFVFSTNFADFGIQYFNFLYDLSKSVLNPHAELKILKLATQGLMYDLNRDQLLRLKNASVILGLNQTLNRFAQVPLNDLDAIKQTQGFKKRLSPLISKIISKLFVEKKIPTIVEGYVLEILNEYSVQKIKRVLENGFLILENGYTYSPNQYKTLVESFDGFNVGEEVQEIFDDPSLQTITHIASDGSYFRLSNGFFYERKYIRRVIK